MKKKMEKMQLAFCKAKGIDDCLYNMGGMSFKTPIALPLKFKTFYDKKFDGFRNLKQHVRRYLSIAKMKGWMRSKLCMHFLSHLREVH